MLTQRSTLLFRTTLSNNPTSTDTVGAAGSPFTFSGLTGPVADIFVYGNVATINGSTGVVTTMNGFTGRFFDDVPIIGGVIAGNFADLTNGATAETAVISGVGTSTFPDP